MKLDDQVAVVTGAASGIGFGMAQQAATRGMRVVLADIEEEALDAAERQLRAAGATTLAVRTDVSRADDVMRLADRAFDAFGSVGLLCNNAGVNVLVTRPIWELSQGDWEWVIGVNLWGLIHGLQAFLPRMMEQAERSHVLNTSSAAGVISGPGLAAYKTTKHAIVTISETLHHDLAAAGAHVSVSVFCPDVVKTQLRTAARNRPERLRDERPPSPEQGAVEKAREAGPGLTPQEAAALAFEGALAGHFYIFTNPWAIGAARRRLEDIETGVPQPAGLREDVSGSPSGPTPDARP